MITGMTPVRDFLPKLISSICLKRKLINDAVTVNTLHYSIKDIKKALDKICKEQNIVKLDCIIMNPPYEGTLHLDIHPHTCSAKYT